jgi:hypothetical protein
MSKYYKAKRVRNLYDPLSRKPYAISRAGIELFQKCPRCFYLNKRLGTATPPAYPYSLNTAVDILLKKEFDLFRRLAVPHPTATYFGINCIPFAHKDLETWRNALRGGIKHLHGPTNLIIKGAVDDIWIDAKDQLHIVDYKSTSKTGEVNIDADWQASYRRQVEVYQWLFRRNGFMVSDVAYFVYANADPGKPAFESKLEFNTKIIAYEGDDSWVEDTIIQLHKCLLAPDLPEPAHDCDYCAYFNQRSIHESSFRRSRIPRYSRSRDRRA